MSTVESKLETTVAATPKKSVKRTVKKATKKVAKKSVKKASLKKAAVDSHDGTVVGYAAKSQEDVKWTELKVAFYKAIKKVGGAGTSAKIAKASNGKIHAGHARHFGYHGVGGGLIKVEEAGGPNSKEGDRGYVFVLTAKGKAIDPDAELKKQATK
jgi:hypothetical protein